MYWTLFAVMLLDNGKIDYSKTYESIATYESRADCEIARARILTFITPPPRADLRCVRTDEA